MLPTVCIEAGRSTLTHTSWPELCPSARKWMSGQAAALAAYKDRPQFANFTAAHPLRDPTPLSVRRPPSPLDFYLSWMSPSQFRARESDDYIERAFSAAIAAAIASL
jgi:hypothetical protein